MVLVRLPVFRKVSLPSRGAWIEMLQYAATSSRVGVAPLAGSVDRNSLAFEHQFTVGVAPLAGSVDRNGNHYEYSPSYNGRSPRGERG